MNTKYFEQENANIEPHFDMVGLPEEDIPDEVQPRFTHDCDACKFLGQIHDEVLYDLYFCPQAGMSTVIARFGNEGREYKSGLHGSQHDFVLYEAKKRAISKGYL